MIVAVLMLASSAGAQDHGLSVRELDQANATSAQFDSEPRRDRDWRRAGGRASLVSAEPSPAAAAPLALVG
ncbi:MAG TPA: hypothetical protein VEX68_10080 [Bryobacteraceae bacterium]|nr:hypothetical protein [Bryobacteraceae bacterium]